MRAIFEGGPLDGRENVEVRDDLLQFEFLEYARPAVIEGALDPTEIYPVIKHVYYRENHVGVAGRFVYQGTR